MDDLYFVQSGGGGPIKIGRSKNPRARLRKMQTGNPEPMSMIALLEGRGYEEKAWHIAFDYLRLSGEWFEEDSDITTAIADAQAGRTWTHNAFPPDDYMIEATASLHEMGSDDPDEEAAVEWAMALWALTIGLRDGHGLADVRTLTPVV